MSAMDDFISDTFKFFDNYNAQLRAEKEPCFACERLVDKDELESCYQCGERFCRDCRTSNQDILDEHEFYRSTADAYDLGDMA